jgi:hypothetical protein
VTDNWCIVLWIRMRHKLNKQQNEFPKDGHTLIWSQWGKYILAQVQKIKHTQKKKITSINLSVIMVKNLRVDESN